MRNTPDAKALRHRAGGDWNAISWAEYGLCVDEIGAGLISLGVAAGDKVAVLCGNRPEWHESDFAVMSVGAITVPVYPTNTASQVAYVLRHSTTRVIVVEDAQQLAKVLLQRHALPELTRVVIVDGPPDGLDDGFVLGFDDLRAMGRDLLKSEPDAVAERRSEITSETVATIVYTSGTTGTPKGAVITHGNLTATIAGITSAIAIGPTDRFLSFLPLSHIAERVVSDFGQVVAGGETWFAESLATVAKDLPACRPTIFFAVPRVWEKLQAHILAETELMPAPVRSVMNRFVELGRKKVAHTHDGAPWPLSERLAYWSLDRTVGSRLRRKIGLDKARLLISGAAPISTDILVWLHAIGLPVGEVYGQTEDCGPTSMSVPGHSRLGTVGRPLPGLEVRIAQDGEVIARGPSVCTHYLDDPEHTAELIDAGGWMHSGDFGSFDRDGYLKITGRKKDLIITSSGKNIAPQELETELRASPLIAQAVLIGEHRSYLTALIALDTAELATWSAHHTRAGGLELLAQDSELNDEIRAVIDRVNENHAPIEQIKTWRILPRELTIAAGEMTPTLKVRREVVSSHYRELIEEMYATRAA